MSVCALGKCGGRELGFASDIELMFVFAGEGKTSGPHLITTSEFYVKLVEGVTHAIRAHREGIFEIDLRLRPYGRAGSLAVSLDAFRDYFGPQGAAWPYERQALVKLRPIAGDAAFGQSLVALLDELIYTGEPFDVAAMQGMRERQVRQLVSPGHSTPSSARAGWSTSNTWCRACRLRTARDSPRCDRRTPCRRLRLSRRAESLPRTTQPGCAKLILS
jgi:glutamate-ammonia-ligase adenylyltransferase